MPGNDLQDLILAKRIKTALNPDAMSHEDFISSFEEVLKVVQQSNIENQKAKQDLVNTVEQAILALQNFNAQEWQTLEQRFALKEKGLDGKDGRDGRDGRDGQDGKTIVGPIGMPGKDGSPDTGEQIITKINTSDGLINRERVEGLEAEFRGLRENISNIPRGGGQNLPLTIEEDGEVVAKVARVLNFIGATVTRTPSGVVNITITGGGGTWMPPETPVGDIDGVNTTYQLSYVPVTYSGVLYVNGQPHFEGYDWTISDGVITMLTPIDSSLANEPLIFHGQYAAAVPVVPSAESTILLQDGTELILQDGTGLLTN